MAKNKKFKKDFRKENPSMHMLFTKRAIKHFLFIDQTIKNLCSFSNSNLFGAIMTLQKEKEKLIKENAAYFEANEILQSIYEAHPIND